MHHSALHVAAKVELFLYMGTTHSVLASDKGIIEPIKIIRLITQNQVFVLVTPGQGFYSYTEGAPGRF